METKLRRQFFFVLNPNDFVPFVPCHHLLAKATYIIQEFWLLAWLLCTGQPVSDTEEQQILYLNQLAEKEQQQQWQSQGSIINRGYATSS